MDQLTRRAFAEGLEHNPAGRNPGTGHWNKLQCQKYIQEWSSGYPPSHEAVIDSLTKERECASFVPYESGFTPPQHTSFLAATPHVRTYVYDVFLSHSGMDDALAKVIAELLFASGVSVFTTPGGLTAGKWEPAIETALKNSDKFWLLLTPDAFANSTWVHQEFGYFFGYHVGIVGQEQAERKLNYFESDSEHARPGMYAHFQGTPVPSFSDSLFLARVIAKSVGKDLKEPDGPVALIPVVVDDWWTRPSAPDFRFRGIASSRRSGSPWTYEATIEQFAGSDVGGFDARFVLLGRTDGVEQGSPKREQDRHWRLQNLVFNPQDIDGGKGELVIEMSFNWDGARRQVLWAWPSFHEYQNVLPEVRYG